MFALSHVLMLSKSFESGKYKNVRLKGKCLIIFALILTFLWPVLCNRPPRFLLDEQSEIVLRLKESPETPVGKLIYKLKGFDPENDPLTFGVRNSAESKIIRIQNVGNNEANIFLSKELDREVRDEYSIVLTLTDDNFVVTQSLLVLVEDINDNEPTFKPYQSSIEIPENSPPGIISTLEATDRDEGAYGQVVYYLHDLDNVDNNQVFSVSTQQGKGVIRLVGELDYERKNLYQLRVLAIDRANQGPVNTGTAAILVKVKDIEDQPPQFIQVQPVTRIVEGAAPGTEVLRVRAIDGDRGVNNKIKYSMERKGNDLFAIDEDSGAIYTRSVLDRENGSNQINGAYILKILAVEVTKIKPPPYVKTEVTIIVTDLNDETPTFREKIYRCEIHENSQANSPVTFLGQVRNEVFDYDQGNNGTFQLFLEPDNEIFEISPLLAVNEANFVVRVKNPALLDYEFIKAINLTVVAKEVTKPAKWSSAKLHISIRDQNDNIPEFRESMYEVSIPENVDAGTLVVQIQAIDLDSGDFGTQGIRYTNITGSAAHLLSLDPITGAITIDSSTHEAFDRELISRHYFTIEARDNLGKGNRNTVQLILNIDDVNDNPPQFLQSQYEAKLLENNVAFENPLVVKAHDADLNGTKNSQITYDIVEGHLRRNFTIDPKSGVLMPKLPIDFEELPAGLGSIKLIELVVRAKDSGVPVLSSRVRVMIYLQDVNDNIPIFQKPFYRKTIAEDLPGGSAVLEVKAYDKDGSAPNNIIVYRIKNGASDKFVINPDTGLISVAKGASLDPDLITPKVTSYSLLVIALDSGLGESQLMAVVTVNISIKDVNNKPPVFHNIEALHIRENTAVGTEVYRLMATDLDETAVLRFHIDPKKSEARTEEGAFVKPIEYDFVNCFELNPLDGILKVVKLLDRERVEQIKLTVVVQDLATTKGPKSASSALTIVIEDENDNNPKFKMPFYRKTIPENSMNGVTIVNVVASDIDKNKTVSYSLEGNPKIVELIHLDSETGEIVVANKIDHEAYQWLNFSVKATDSGFPPRSSLVDVLISVLDENDNNPFFLTSMKNFTVSENVPIGTRVGTIQASDADSGDFGKITFLMDRISSQGKFSIDADTGVLTVADKLDRETKDFYMLVIEAWDNYQFGYLAGESRNAFKQIFINVLDENDSPPVLIMPQECIQITEYHETKDIIAPIKGTDNDDPNLANGRIEFSITKGNEHGLFQLDQVDYWTAHLYALGSLKGKYGNYTLIIQAKDLGAPSNIVKKPLHVCISDFNDHPPVFISPSHNVTVRVPENATVGSLIIQVLATDEDIGANAAVRYRLKPDFLGNYRTFDIDEKNGMIFLKEQLDREKQKIYEIRVEAYDQGIPTSLSTDLDLTIYVRNVNDYEPQFLVEDITVNFTEHSPPGLQKVKLPDTIDRDEVDELDDPPSAVCYFIIYGNEDEIFHLDSELHILTVQKELDREIKANYTLYVRATENCSAPPSVLAMKDASTEGLIQPSKMNTLPFVRRTNITRQNAFDRFKYSRNLRSARDTREALASFTDVGDDVPFIQDSTVVRVTVYVQDINDNPPRFISKIFTGGITTNVDFGTKFMEIRAIDPDDGINANVSYYQIGEIRQTLSEGLDNIQKAPFLVEKFSGAIHLNFDPQKGMRGYFDFMVLANDTDGQKDTAHVYIYLLREDQKVRFVFRQQPSELRSKINLFRDTLGNVTDAIVNVDEFKVHENKDGSVDKTKTDIYLHLVDKRDNSIFEVADVLKLIDRYIEKLDDLFKEFNVLDTQPAEAEMLIGTLENGSMFIWLVFSNIFIATLLLVTLSLCVSQRSKYRRQLRAAKVNIFANPTSETIRRTSTAGVPNTNKHSVEGSNPIWLSAYENEWFKNDDEVSTKGLDSIDDNVIVENVNAVEKTSRLFSGQQNDLNRYFNVYHQIDKLTNNAEILAKKLETTEL